MNIDPITYKSSRTAGFTLIELVIGIVVLAISMTVVITIFLPQTSKVTTSMYQIKATALGKSILDQVLLRYYDENSDRSGGVIRCGEVVSGAILIPCSSTIGLEKGEVKSKPNNFNDVDDYDVYCDDRADYDSRAALAFFTADYPGYGIRICVSFAADKFASTAPASTTDVAKRILLTVFMPNNDAIQFSAFKGNY